MSVELLELCSAISVVVSLFFFAVEWDLMGVYLISEDNEIPEIQLELSLLDKLKAHVQLARQIETSHHKVKKANHDRNWMRDTAKAMDIELDSDFVRSVEFKLPGF